MFTLGARSVIWCFAFLLAPVYLLWMIDSIYGALYVPLRGSGPPAGGCVPERPIEVFFGEPDTGDGAY